MMNRYNIWQICRFGVVGGISFVIYYGLYIALSRWFWPTGNHTLESFLANAVAVVFNFFGHREYTFRVVERHHAQLIRYLIVLAGGVGLQVLFFWLGHSVFKVYDLVVAPGAIIISSLFTFFTHQAFTFKTRNQAI